MTSTVASGSSGITQNSGQFICIVTIIIIKYSFGDVAVARNIYTHHTTTGVMRLNIFFRARGDDSAVQTKYSTK